MKHFFCLLLSLCVFSELLAFKTGELSLDKNTYFTLENDCLILYFNRQGGRLDRIFYKQGDMEFVNRTFRGAFTENDWNRGESRDFLYKRMFQLSHEQKGDSFTVTCKGHHMGGGIDFLEVTKRFTIREGSPVIQIEYDFYNQLAAMSRVLYSIQIHNAITLVGAGHIQYYMPGLDGIQNGNGWMHAPSRGWMAADSARGVGCALTMSFPELYNFLIWEQTTMEWRCIPMHIENGAHFRTSAEMIPFRDLPLVSGAGKGTVGALIHKTKAAPGESIPVEVRIFGGVPGKITAELFRRDNPDEKWQSLQKASLDFPKGNEMQSFRASVSRSGNGGTELEALIRSSDGKELCRLNSRIVFGETDTPWKIDLLEKKMKSAVNAVDLTSFTHVDPDPEAVPWARPLPGGKIKVLALVPYIAQFGDLSQRMDVTYAMCWIGQNSTHLEDPNYLLNEHAGSASMNDLTNNLKKVLKADYDVIFLGGISWRLLPEEIQKLILRKVENGTGLVYTGVDDGNDFLHLKNLSWWRKTVKGTPKAVRNSPLTSGVPFDLFPEGNIFSLTGGGEIHAKAGENPYLVTSKLGKGRIVGYCYAPNLYHSGIIPNDPAGPYYIYRNPTPYELYFSMLAKGILYAAGRETPLTFEQFSAETAKYPACLTWKASVKQPENTRWDYFVTDRNNEIRERGSRDVWLKAGSSDVTLEIPLEPYAGKQCVSVIVRNAKGEVLNWGSWSVDKEPSVKIASVESDRKNYRDGDTVSYTVKLEPGAADPKLRVDLVDSYHRVLQRKEGPAKEIAKGSFVLHDALPSRYAKIRAYLYDNGHETDTGGCFFYTRPAEKLLGWDDYKINSIIYWTGLDSNYRMRRTSDIYRKLGLDILMNCWGNDFVLLNNFAPRAFAHNNIGSQNFPSKEYLNTGNKMLLVRKNNCLSDESLNEKLRNQWKEQGILGDSISVQFYDSSDEMALSRSGQPVEFCFSEHCLKNFRKFLEKRYGTLDKLNAAWETGFKNWNDVIPFTKEEVWGAKGKHVAGWADHREFMEELCYTHLKEAIDTIRKYDPKARLSNSGTIAPNAYGGLDWWKFMKLFDCLENYNELLSDEIHRSFAREGYASIPWYVGYGSKGQDQVHKVWRSAFVGSSGISLWCLYSGILYPDLTPQTGMRDALPHLTALHNGIGKLLMGTLKTRPPEAAILYSQASLRAAFIEKRMDEYRELWCKYIRLCRNFGVEFKFISYEQLADGILDHSSYKLLILPDSTALSDKEIDAIRRFFQDGGCVLAEGLPGTRYENCVKRKDAPLRALFRKSGGRSVLLDKPDTDYNLLITAPDSKLNRKQLLSEQGHFAAILKKAGIEARPFRLLNPDGSPVAEAEYYLRRSGDGTLFAGIVSDNPVAKQVTLETPEKGYVYNLVNGQYLGFGDRFTLSFQQGCPLAVAILKEKPEIASFTASGDTVTLKLKHPLETVVRFTVTAPDGKEVMEYARNENVRGDKVQYTVPFALSDAPGIWKITAKEAFSGTTAETELLRK